VSVTVPCDPDRADAVVLSVAVGEGEVLVLAQAEEAKAEGASNYRVALLPGSLLLVDSHGPQETAFNFHYIFTGREDSPLSFRAADFGATLGGDPVYVDLASPGAAAWLAKQPAGALKTVRTVRLGGGATTDAAALRRLSGLPLLVTIPEQYSLADRPKVASALAAARPTGIVAKKCEGLAGVLPRLPGLTHLVAEGSAAPALPQLKELRHLSVDFGDRRTSLEWLGELPRLRYLTVAGKAADYAPVGRLARLRGLSISSNDLSDLKPLEGLGDLRMLFVATDEPLKDISAVAAMPRLRELALLGIAPEADLRPIARLKGLKVLMVTEDDLEDRKADLDVIRKALPDVKIVGFCMGSAWIFVVVSVGGAAGLLARRLRRREKVAS
jgi:hypothetical protein